MTCPDCGHDNLGGADACGNCGQDLRSVDVLPRSKTRLARNILDTPLRDLDPAPAIVVAPDTPVAGVIRTMQQSRQGSVLVVDQKRLVGIFTERDVLNRLAGEKLDLAATPVREVMTRDPKTLRDDDTLALALHRMAVGSYRHIPVVHEGKPPRFISVRGVLRHLHEHSR